MDNFTLKRKNKFGLHLRYGVYLWNKSKQSQFKKLKMNINQKVYAIVKKDTKEIVLFSLTANAVYAEWSDYFVGTPEEQTHELQQTFMSQDEIKKQMSL